MYLFFDTETNGLPKNWKAPISDLSNWPRLVQIAWILYDQSGNEIERNDHIIKPQGFSIPREAASIHGITTEKANAEGVDLQWALDEFNTQVQKALHLVAHNMDFDEKIVGAEFLRNNMLNPIANKKKICTMKATTNYVAIEGYYGYKWPKLSELHQKLFGFDFEEAHNAAADINATAKCFWEAKRLGII
ncbi:MAG TPA: 3'-5' exonuclease [Chitinophagales bacterium]|nr:3'-5' exonuclease [Chitinophagales bacterium]